jgi:hypothetical protein
MITRVMNLADIEVTKRSAAMAPLPPETVNLLLSELQQHVAERERILAVLSELPPTFGALREALNELHRLVS